MAKTNTAEDTATAALLAIETALNLDLKENESAKPGEQGSDQQKPQSDSALPKFNFSIDQSELEKEIALGSHKQPPKLPDVGERPLFANNPNRQRPAFQAGKDLSDPNAKMTGATKPLGPNLPPANDDKRTTGEIMRAMNVHVGRTPFLWASLASVAWVVLIGSYAYTNFQSPLEISPQTLFFGVFALAPILFFYIIASLFCRAQEMRLTARAMTQVAIRLAEPETLASEQVVTLSQAIRREVASMGDGIERALARASELEALVHSEVANLERSYGDNERRVRSLIDLLSSEREAIIGNADRVRTAILGAQEALSKDLNEASVRITEDVEQAGSRVTHSLGSKGQEITYTLSSTGERLIDQISDRGNDIVHRLNNTGDLVSEQLNEASQKVTVSLSERIGVIDQRLRGTGEALLVELGARCENLKESLDKTSERIAHTISTSGEGLTTRLTQTGERLYETITHQGFSLTEQLEATGSTISASLRETSTLVASSLSTSGQELTARLTETGDKLYETIAHHGSSLSEQLETTGSSIAISLEETSAHAATRLDELAQANQKMFTQSTETLAHHLSTHQNHLTQRVQELNSEISANLVNHDESLQRGADQTKAQILAALTQSRDTHEQMFEQGYQVAHLIVEQTQMARQSLGEGLTGLSERLGELQNQIYTDVIEEGRALDLSLAATGKSISAMVAERSAEARDLLNDAHSALHQQLHEHREVVVTALSEHAQQLNQAVVNTSDSALQALNQSGESIVVALNTVTAEAAQQADTLYDKLIATSEQTLSALVAQTGRLGDLGQDLSDHSEQLHERLTATLQDLHNKISQTGESHLASLSAQSSDFHESFRTESQTLQENLMHLADEKRSAMLESALSFQAGFHSVAEETLVKFSQKSKDLHDQFATTTQNAAESLGQRTADFNRHFADLAVEVVEAIGTHGDRASANIINRIKTFEELTADQGGLIDERLSRHGDKIAALVENRLNQIEDAIVLRGSELDQRLEERVRHTANALDERVMTLEERSSYRTKEVADTFDALISRVDSGLEARAKSLNQILVSRAIEVARVLGEGGREVTLALDAKAQEINATLGGRTTEIAATLDNRISEFEEKVVRRLDTASARINERSNEVSSTLKNHVADIETIFVRHETTFKDASEGFNSNLTTRVETITSVLDKKGEIVGDVLERRLESFESAFDGFSNTLMTRASVINDVLEDKGAQVGEILDKRLAAFETALSTHITQTSKQLIDNDQALERIIIHHGEKAATLLQGSLLDFEHRITDDLDRVSRTIDTHSHSINGSVAKTTQQLQHLLESASQTLDTTLADRSRDLGSTLVSRLNEIDTTLTSRLSAVHAALGERSQELNDTLASRAGELFEALDHKGPLLVDLISSRGADVSREMTNVGELLSHTIDKHGRIFIDQLERKQDELTQGIDRSTFALQDALENGAGRSISTLTALSDTLRHHLTGAIGKLEDTSSGLGALVSSADHNLNALQSVIGTRVNDFSKMLGAVAEQVTALNRSAATTLFEGKELADRVETHVHSLSLASADLMQLQSGVDSTLEARRQALESLIGEFSLKAGEFQNFVKAVGQRIDTTFDHAQHRASEIGQYLAETSSQGSRTLDQHLDSLRDYQHQTEQVLNHSLSQAREKTRQELDQLFTGALDGVRHSVEQMRGLSSQLRSELEGTRRVVFEGLEQLPLQTSEKTAEVSRIVGDQLRALNQISEIIVQSGHGVDAIGLPKSADASSSSSAANQSSAAAAGERERRVPPLRPSYAASKATSLPEADLSPSQGTGTDKQIFDRPVRVESLRVESPRAHSSVEHRDSLPQQPTKTISELGTDMRSNSANSSLADDRVQSGWLSNILARASREEKATSMNPTAERSSSNPLEQLPFDIANMVNAQNAAEAWNRYRRGENNAFTLNLYSTSGRQTFEEIRRRYQNDSQFRGTIDRYIQEFERLLNDVNRSDTNGVQVRNYLISDTGRVYTMLAHAAGRLGA